MACQKYSLNSYTIATGCTLSAAPNREGFSCVPLQ
jgi:hypothetical protein